jgi:uncharacterized protein (UPF0548 family)
VHTFWLRRPPEGALGRVIADQAGQELTYPEHGATAGAMPSGYRHDRWRSDLGAFSGDRFERAALALRNWAVQRGAGLTVFPGGDIEPGMTFVLTLRLPVGHALAAGRIVYVTDEPGRYGFAYGTLPLHPEQGEEAFLLSRDAGRLVFTVAAFSRPRHPLARLGAPVARRVQLRTNRAYQRAMQSAAR